MVTFPVSSALGCSATTHAYSPLQSYLRADFFKDIMTQARTFVSRTVQTLQERATLGFADHLSYFLPFPVAEAASINPQSFPSSFNLSTVNGKNGCHFLDGHYKGSLTPGITGANEIGDINGDGYGDMAFTNGYSGVYVLFGDQVGWNTPYQLTDSINGKNGFFIEPDKSDAYGVSATAVKIGDVNFDRIDDLLLGGGGTNAPSCAIGAIIYGSKKPWTSSFKLSSLDGKNGYFITARTCSSVDIGAVGLGDVNGDAIPDFALSDRGFSIDWVDTGITYVVFGSRTFNKASLDVQKLDGVNGFFLVGENHTFSGSSLAALGDFNVDGIDDIGIGAMSDSITGGGTGYVIFGQKQWNRINYLSNLNGENGFKIAAEQGGMIRFIAGPGNINGDGAGDLSIGALKPPHDGKNVTGINYVLFGSSKSWNPIFEVSDINGKNGFSITNGSFIDESPFPGGNKLGDVNGDGIDDFSLLHTVIFGSTSWPANLDISNLGNKGFVFEADPGVYLGLFPAGDLNKDKVDDIAVVDTVIKNNSFFWGEAYAIFGQR